MDSPEPAEVHASLAAEESPHSSADALRPRVQPAELDWTVLLDPPMDGASNMARDHALALTLPPGTAVLRLYRWSRPTLSFGRNEPAGPFREAGARSLADVDFVRRPTGGRAVLHDRELTYAVVVPLRALGGVRAAYRAVNRGLMNALRALGAPAELAAGTGEAAHPDAGPCFQRAAPGEITVAGRKLVGSAQARIEGALLQHGSLLMEGDQSRLDQLAGWPEEAARLSRDGPSAPPTSLAEILGSVPRWEDLAELVVHGMAEALGGRWGTPLWHGRGTTDPGTEQELVARYRSASWTWRR
jgi:lipoate-protein ligase A